MMMATKAPARAMTMTRAVIGVAAMGLLLAGGCASSDDLRTDVSASTTTGIWQDDPARTAIVAWEAAVGDDAVRFSVLGPVSISADQWGPDGPASMAAIEAEGVSTSSPFTPRIMTHRTAGTRQELEVHEMDGGQWCILGWEGDRAWRLDPEIEGLANPLRVAGDGGDAPAERTSRPSMRVRSVPQEPLLGLSLAWPMVGGREFAWDQRLQQMSLVDWLDASDEIDVRITEDGRHEVRAVKRRFDSAPFEGRHLAVASESEVLIRLRVDPRPRIEEVTVSTRTGHSRDPDVVPAPMLQGTTRWFGMDFVAAGPADVARRARVWHESHRPRRTGRDRLGNYMEYRRLDPAPAFATPDVAWDPFPPFPPAAALRLGTLIRDEHLGVRYTIGDDRVRAGSATSSWRLIRLDGSIDSLLGPDWERRGVEVLGAGGPPSMDPELLFPGLNSANGTDSD